MVVNHEKCQSQLDRNIKCTILKFIVVRLMRGGSKCIVDIPVLTFDTKCNVKICNPHSIK